MTGPFFSIIIPVKAINDYVRETVSYILKLKDQDWELLIVPNDSDPSEWTDPRIQIISSGRIGPGAKRDMAAKIAKGSVLVFLDDDSYPRSDLLTNARQLFNDENVSGLGGPAITPQEDGFWQKVSGAVFLSRFSGGIPERYIPLGPVREIYDWPSVNLMVKREDFLAVGGFNSLYWPGEDTKLCLALVKSGKRLLYSPHLVVWHHRRSGLWAHLKQVGAYGLHRGFFAKIYPETSFKIIYFAPSVLFLFFALTMLILITGYLDSVVLLKYLLNVIWTIYGLALIKAFLDFMHHVNLLIALNAIIYTFFTHMMYGMQFIKGFIFTKKLVSKLR